MTLASFRTTALARITSFRQVQPSGFTNEVPSSSCSASASSVVAAMDDKPFLDLVDEVVHLSPAARVNRILEVLRSKR